MSDLVVREFIDLVVIVPLEEELLSVLEVLTPKDNRSTATSFRQLVDVGLDDVKCLVVQQLEMGKTASSQATTDVLSDYDVGILVCVGIAGSLSGDMNLADVCYTGSLMDVYDNTKTSDAPNGGVLLSLSPDHFDTPVELTTALNFLRTQPELRDLYRRWQEERAAVAHKLLPDPLPARRNDKYTVRSPNTRSGMLVCGSVSKSQAYNEMLSGVDRKVLAIETESGGLFTVARRQRIPAMSIRGVSDYADGKKSKLEEKTAGKVRTLAAGNAATFLKLQFRNPFFIQQLKANARQQSLQYSALGNSLSERKSLPDLLAVVGQEVDQHLRDLCPEYKLQASGYKLPIPRGRRRENSGNVNADARSTAHEMRSIVENQKLVVLDLPRAYPDQALPWMIANDLLTAEIAGCQVVPVVVDGERISPPRSGLARVGGYDLAEIASRPGAIPVVIIDNCPFSSKSRLKYLLTEVERHPEVHFVLVARGDGALVFSSDVAVQFKAELFEVCDVSFLELTHFVERNFQLSGSEAEVIAYRLQETFKRYELSAHPSYFAGISNTTLAALINANRRSELIQLAVDGTLSFVVADDSSDVSLSRTTRSRFLQKLVRAIRVDGRMFNEAELVRFTTEFANEFDFAINGLTFISAFVERGILHFEGGRVTMSLPYVESYLLAKELLTDPVAAENYFSSAQTDFDYPTFDIYAELGPAEAIVKSVDQALTGAIESLPGIDGRQHAIMTSRLAGAEGAATARFEKLHSQMQQAIDEVVGGQRASERKQQILDMRNDVRSTAAREARETSSSPEQRDASLQLLTSCLRAWNAGLILLNSAAEQLRGSVKRELASKIIVLSSSILDYWTAANSKVDFKLIKEALTSDSYLEEFLVKHSLTDQNHVRETIRMLMDGIVDLLEEYHFCSPLLTVLGGTTRAHQRVLGMSLSQIQLSRDIEQLVHSIWHLEVDPASGEERAIGLIRLLPRAPVLRGAICNHLVSSAYWNHSNLDEKKRIVSVANAAIKPFAQRIDPKILTNNQSSRLTGSEARVRPGGERRS